jgi:hypothetical protein
VRRTLVILLSCVGMLIASVAVVVAMNAAQESDEKIERLLQGQSKGATNVAADEPLAGRPEETTEPTEPKKVCEHIHGLMRNELGAQFTGMSEQDITNWKHECIEGAERERVRKNSNYEEEAKCIVAARLIEDIDICMGKLGGDEIPEKAERKEDTKMEKQERKAPRPKHNN